MDVSTLTENQLKILRFIAKTIDLTGCQPSYREICKEFGWASVNAPAQFLNDLEEKGVVTKCGARAVSFDWRSFL